MTQRETPISRQARAALLTSGFPCVRIQSGRVKVRGGWMHLAPPGHPDLLVEIKPPVYGLLEAKAEDGKLREAQKVWHAKARRRGVLVEVFTSAKEAVEIAMGWRRGFEKSARASGGGDL